MTTLKHAVLLINEMAVLGSSLLGSQVDSENEPKVGATRLHIPLLTLLGHRCTRYRAEEAG